jgi:hypothetical protein
VTLMSLIAMIWSKRRRSLSRSQFIGAIFANT